MPKDRLEEVRPQGMLGEDDRPTEIHDPAAHASVHTTRDQLITGSTIAEMMGNMEHKLSAPLAELYRRAQRDLPGAKIDPRATLKLKHEFEFDRRTGYQLLLKLFDGNDRCVEVTARVDQDGRKIRRGSLISKLIEI